MKSLSSIPLVMVSLTILIGGCSTIWHHGSSEAPLPQTSATPTASHPTPTARKSRTRVPGSRTGHSAVASKTQSPAGVPESAVSLPVTTPPAGVAPTGTTNVTLEDNDADREQARTLVDGANARLAHIDRSKLTGEASAAFRQASDLASAAGKAMEQHDYLAASGLARKASMLSDQVAGRISSQ
jgi:hypothetical protein